MRGRNGSSAKLQYKGEEIPLNGGGSGGQFLQRSSKLRNTKFVGLSSRPPAFPPTRRPALPPFSWHEHSQTSGRGGMR